MYRDIAFIWAKFVPLDRDLGCFNRYTGTSRSPYKRNRENNSKLSTSRDVPVHRDHINRPLDITLIYFTLSPNIHISTNLPKLSLPNNCLNQPISLIRYHELSPIIWVFFRIIFREAGREYFMIFFKFSLHVSLRMILK